jgi:hypothetical protein
MWQQHVDPQGRLRFLHRLRICRCLWLSRFHSACGDRLSEYSSVGSLMGSLTRGSLFIEGQIPKWMYWALHKQHQLALSGPVKTALITLSELLDRVHRPRIKLH